MLVPGMAFAQNTGKISGEVVDANTGEPLPGANVRVEGTTQGAATNSNGEYTIPQVQPGTYTIQVTFVGYQTVRRTNVEVVGGITKRLDFELQEAEFEGQEVVVRAEEPLVNQTATNAVRRLGREEFSDLPTRSAETYYAIQPGVTLQNGDIHVRGGRSNETDFLLDGLSSRSLLGSNNVIAVIPEALEETQVLLGGYSADKGGANGGIVQQTLRTGGSELSASLQYEGDQLASSFNDTYSYGDQDIVGTIGGPLYWDNVRFFVAGNYRETDNSNPIFWEGANLNYSSQGGLCEDISAADCHAPVDDNSRPEIPDTADKALSWEDGELPGVGRPREELRLNGTLTFDFDPLRLRVSGVQTTVERRDNDLPTETFYNTKRVEKQESTRRLISVQPTYFLNDNTYIEASVGYFQFNVEQYDPLLGAPGSGGAGGRLDDITRWSDQYEVANAVGLDTTGVSGMTETEVAALMDQNRYTRSWQGRFQTPPEFLFNGFNFQRPGASGVTYLERKQSYWKGRTALISQQGAHEINVGGEYKRWTVRNYVMSDFLSGNAQVTPGYLDSIRAETQSVTERARAAGFEIYGYDEYGRELDSGPDGAKHPVEASAWINDKIEFEDIIVNAGLRFNYYDMDNWEPRDRANPPYLPGENTVAVGDSAGLKEVDADMNLLPRIGLSFPIGDKTVFHLQYGKFSQMPDLGDVYTGRSRMARIFEGGNFFSTPFAFDVDPIETTQYEIGFGYQFSEFAAFDLTAYYRRTDGQLQIVRQDPSPASTASGYNLYVNGDFSITRGVEVSLKTKRIGGVLGRVNYSLSDAKGTNSSPSGQVSAIENEVQRPTAIQPLEFMQRHQGSVILDYRSGTDQPIWARDWGVNLLYQFSSGRRYTRSTSAGGIGQRGADEGPLLPDDDPRFRIPLEPVNASSTPFTSTLDMRLSKGFDLGPAQASAYIYVQNLLNERNIRNVYLRTGNAENDGFFSNPELSAEIVQGRGQRYVDYYQAINLNNRKHYRNDWDRDVFGEPRQVRVGVEISY
jgi:hypothetical protein